MTAGGTIYWGSYLLPFGDTRMPLADAGVYVRDGDATIAGLGQVEALRLRFPGAREAGGNGSLVMPGLIDAHQHGRAVPPQQLGVPDQELETWLLAQRAMPRLDPALSAAISAARAVLGGVTTLLHPHVTADPSEPAAEETRVLEAFITSGARVVFGMDVRDRGSFSYADDQSFEASLPDTLTERTRATFPRLRAADLDELDARLAALRAAAQGSLVAVVLAPRGPQWCTDQTLDWLAARRHEGSALQLHCSETRAQFGYFAERGETPVGFLARMDLLAPCVTLAHCVWLTQDDIAVLADTGSVVAHNPSSNLRLGSGRAPVARLRAAGVPVAIGSDSAGLDGGPDLFAEVRLGRLLEQAPVGEFAHDTLGAFELAANGGSRAGGTADGVGALREGGPADLVVLAAGRASDATRARGPQQAAVELVLQRVRREDVTDVVVAGRQLVRDGRYLPFDLSAAEQELAEQLERAVAEPERRQTVTELRPYVERERRRLAALTDAVDFAR